VVEEWGGQRREIRRWNQVRASLNLHKLTWQYVTSFPAWCRCRGIFWETWIFPSLKTLNVKHLDHGRALGHTPMIRVHSHTSQCTTVIQMHSHASQCTPIQCTWMHVSGLGWWECTGMPRTSQLLSLQRCDSRRFEEVRCAWTSRTFSNYISIELVIQVHSHRGCTWD